uniref:tyrosine--tRNA ligase n=1 Tax=Triticum urartu TaxID=4572 RepID=A0A8R7PZF5_TRIUA
MLTSFKEGQKMSKSNPSLDIFMDDSEGLVKLKINKAFCPIKIVEGNICLEYIEHIVFPSLEKFEIVRHESHGGSRTYLGMEEFVADYHSGALHPRDVKNSLAKAINDILQPVRDHFNKNNEAKVLHNIVKVH